MNEVGKCRFDDIFTEEYRVDNDADNLYDLNTFDLSAFSDMLETLLKVDLELSIMTLSGAALLVLSLYYKAPGAPGSSGRTEENHW